MKAAGGPLFPLIPLENNGYNSKSHFFAKRHEMSNYAGDQGIDRLDNLSTRY